VDALTNKPRCAATFFYCKSIYFQLFATYRLYCLFAIKIGLFVFSLLVEVPGVT